MSDTPATLTKFGTGFQTKAIASILGKQSFLAQSRDIIDPMYFDNDAEKWIVGTILSYYDKYKRIPTADVFSVETQKLGDDILQLAISEQLRKIYQHSEDTDLEYVRNLLLSFARNQLVKEAALQIGILAVQEKYDEIRVVMNEALQAGEPKDTGHDWKHDVESRFVGATRDTVATGWEPLDILLDGGLGKGELGIFMAPSGIGKSWCLATLGANAARAGLRVVHYTLELHEAYVGTRYDTIFTGIEPNKIRDNADAVRNAVEEIKGEIKIKYYPTKSVTCASINAHLQQLIATGFSPDLIIVDYGDLLKSSERVETRHLELGTIYEELRGLAGEYQVPCWTASQTQRSSINDNIIEADKIAESYMKIMTGDVVISLSRKLEDKEAHTGRVHVIKNRFGSDGVTFPLFMDTAAGKIEVYDRNTSRGIELERGAQNRKANQRLELASKYEKFFTSENSKPAPPTPTLMTETLFT